MDRRGIPSNQSVVCVTQISGTYDPLVAGGRSVVGYSHEADATFMNFYLVIQKDLKLK